MYFWHCMITPLVAVSYRVHPLCIAFNGHWTLHFFIFTFVFISLYVYMQCDFHCILLKATWLDLDLRPQSAVRTPLSAPAVGGRTVWPINGTVSLLTNEPTPSLSSIDTYGVSSASVRVFFVVHFVETIHPTADVSEGTNRNMYSMLGSRCNNF